MASDAKIQKAVEILAIFNDVMELVKDKPKIKKEIDILQRKLDDINMNVTKEKKKANTEMEEFVSINNQEINNLLDQKSSLEGALNRLQNEIKAKKESITNFDKQIDDLKITVSQLNLERNGLEEEVEGFKATAKTMANKFSE